MFWLILQKSEDLAGPGKSPMGQTSAGHEQSAVSLSRGDCEVKELGGQTSSSLTGTICAGTFTHPFGFSQLQEKGRVGSSRQRRLDSERLFQDRDRILSALSDNTSRAPASRPAARALL